MVIVDNFMLKEGEIHSLYSSIEVDKAINIPFESTNVLAFNETIYIH